MRLSEKTINKILGEVLTKESCVTIERERELRNYLGGLDLYITDTSQAVLKTFEEAFCKDSTAGSPINGDD